MTTRLIAPADLKVERLQTRANTNSLYVDELAGHMKAGTKFPPIHVFEQNGDAWLPDGIHRLEGAIQAGVKILVEFHEGTRAQAIEFGIQANRHHGLRWSKADQKRVIDMAIKEFGDRSDRWLADLCGVSPTTIGAARKQVSSSGHLKKSAPKTRVGKDGKSQPASKPPKPKKAGDQKSDARLWGHWETTFSKLRKIPDDLNRDFPHANLHAEVVRLLNAAHANLHAWKRSVR